MYWLGLVLTVLWLFGDCLMLHDDCLMITWWSLDDLPNNYLMTSCLFYKNPYYQVYGIVIFVVSRVQLSWLALIPNFWPLNLWTSDQTNKNMQFWLCQSYVFYLSLKYMTLPLWSLLWAVPNWVCLRQFPAFDHSTYELQIKQTKNMQFWFRQSYSI